MSIRRSIPESIENTPRNTPAGDRSSKLSGGNGGVVRSTEDRGPIPFGSWTVKTSSRGGVGFVGGSVDWEGIEQ